MNAKATACPFCGLATDVPHVKQEVCIEALQVEITRMRGMLGEMNAHMPNDRLRVPTIGLTEDLDNPADTLSDRRGGV